MRVGQQSDRTQAIQVLREFTRASHKPQTSQDCSYTLSRFLHFHKESTMVNSDDFWPVEIKGQIKVCVSKNLNQMSTYVLLEQEDWFEDEMQFIRSYITSNMNAFDIGSNHGVYALTIAKSISEGKIWAFEPTSAPRSLLANSICINNFDEILTLVPAGLSDSNREAEISVSVNSELNSLYAVGETKENIQLLSLDTFIEANALNCSIDFVKLDAEGEEIAILRGGREFFGNQSPLVMFELKHGNEVNFGLIEGFQSLGYDIYRLLPDVGILVNYTNEFSDPYLLNLFACKPDRAQQLAERGLLTTSSEVQKAELCFEDTHWKEVLFEFEFAKEFETDWLAAEQSMSDEHHRAISAALLASDASLPAHERVALLHQSLELLNTLGPPAALHVSVWLTKVNLLHRLGFREQSVEMSRKLSTIVPSGLKVIQLPFLPPSDRFYGRSRGDGLAGEWLVALLREFHEYRKAFSSFFSGSTSLEVDFGRPEMQRGLELERRLALRRGRTGSKAVLPETHPLLDAQLSANSAIWRQIVLLSTPPEQH